jgi:hypothetical protein
MAVLRRLVGAFSSRAVTLTPDRLELSRQGRGWQRIPRDRLGNVASQSRGEFAIGGYVPNADALDTILGILPKT